MPFGTPTQLVTAGQDASSANLTSGTVTASASVGAFVFVLVAKDNTATTDVTTQEVVSVFDSAGNTYNHIGSFTNGQGAALAGAHIAVFAKVITNAITIGSTTFTADPDGTVDMCFVAWVATVGAGNGVRVAGSIQTLANDGADPGSMSISGLTSKEYLFLRAIALESELTTVVTPSTNYAPINGTISSTAGASAANMRVAGEWDIDTNTGTTSDPTLFAADCASLLVAFEEFTPVAGLGALLSDNRSKLIGGGLVVT